MKFKLLVATILCCGFIVKAQNLSDNNLHEELVTKEIQDSEIITFKDAQNPPLAPDCKSNWKIDKQKECTSQFIQRHLARKFNTNLASDVLGKGRVKINIAFTIDETGSPSNITANGGPEILNNHAIEITKLLPKLKPATRNGKPIKVSFTTPLIFQMAE